MIKATATVPTNGNGNRPKPTTTKGEPTNLDAKAADALALAGKLRDLAGTLPNVTTLNEIEKTLAEIESATVAFFSTAKGRTLTDSTETFGWSNFSKLRRQLVDGARGNTKRAVLGTEIEFSNLELPEHRRALVAIALTAAVTLEDATRKVLENQRKNDAVFAATVSEFRQAQDHHPALRSVLELAAFVNRAWRESRGKTGGVYATELQSLVIGVASATDFDRNSAVRCLRAADEIVNGGDL